MESLETQHALDLLQIMVWLFVVVGSAFVGVMIWIGMRVESKLDGIETQIGKTNDTLVKIDRDLRAEINHQDHRLTVVETILQVSQ